MNNVFVYCELEGTTIADVSLELLTKGRKLANQLNCQLEAIVAGSGLEGIEKQVMPYGVDKVHIFDAPGLFPYTSLPHSSVLINLFKEEKPQICLMGATVIGRDLGPRVSSALTSGLTADCTSLEIGSHEDKRAGKTYENLLYQIRPAFGGNIVATIINPEHRPQMATVREGVMKKEILDLGYEVSQVEDGRVTFIGDAEAICRANIFLRTTERVLLKVGSFHAETFEELFQGTRAIPWEEYLPKDAKFWVAKASSIKSKLFSPSDIQSIMKKAMVERMKKAYGIEWFPESGASFPLRVFLHKDTVTVALDTTGESLHKRGYRTLTSKAPITETLAAALIMLTPWKSDRILVDPFCGSGTFPIEAAMIAANMAPGMNREFLSEDWKHLIPRKCWYDAMDEANDLVDLSVQTDIQGYDIDGDIIRAARANAKAAGVDELIHFQQRPVSGLSHPKKYGFLITNPPYGERIEEKKNLPELYKTIGERFAALDSWSAYIITAYEDTERYFGRKADKNRKIYNGMMKTYFYQFLGPKPPARKREERKEEQ